MIIITSGKVPLEKTIRRQVCIRGLVASWKEKLGKKVRQYLATSAITDNYEFPANIGHDVKFETLGGIRMW